MRTNSSFYLNGGKYWYVGIENTVDEGIKRFLSSLEANGEILIDEPIIISFLEDALHTEEENIEIHFVIVAQALPKLEYLAYKAKQVGKNV